MTMSENIPTWCDVMWSSHGCDLAGEHELHICGVEDEDLPDHQGHSQVRVLGEYSDLKSKALGDDHCVYPIGEIRSRLWDTDNMLAEPIWSEWEPCDYLFYYY